MITKIDIGVTDMSKMDNSKVITPVEVVQKNNPLIKDIARVSQKWGKRWAEIDQPWPVIGTFNPEVIKTIQVLVSIYKANEKKGRKGERRKQKRQTELGILQLFEKEGQKWTEMKKGCEEKTADEIKRNVKTTEKLMAESDAPFSHVVPVQRPPPYQEEMELRELYPQLPVISQEGNYRVKNEDEQVIEVGKAETTIRMYPSTKSKRKTTRLETRGRLRIKKMDFGEEDDQSDQEEAMGGYDPAVRRLLARAERRGGKTESKKELSDESEIESEKEGSDEGSDSESPSSLKLATVKSAHREEER